MAGPRELMLSRVIETVKREKLDGKRVPLCMRELQIWESSQESQCARKEGSSGDEQMGGEQLLIYLLPPAASTSRADRG